MLEIKIDPVEKFTELDVRNDISLPEQRKAAADFVRAGIEEAKNTNRLVLGRVPPFTVTVDGREGAPLESVNPDGGNVTVEFELVGDALVWIAQTLVDRSPRVSGEYIRGHALYADGAEVDPFGVIPSADTYVFTNSVPYTRKIEIGKVKGPPARDFVIQVPNRIYERTAEDAKARFGNTVKIRFTYQALQGGAIGKWASSPSAQRLASRHKRRTKSTEWLTNQPAIIVQFLGK
jgi:hypothetical protein